MCVRAEYPPPSMLGEAPSVGAVAHTARSPGGSIRARPYRRVAPNRRRLHQLPSQREDHMFMRKSSDQLQSDREAECGNAYRNAECRLPGNIEDRQELIGVLTLPHEIQRIEIRSRLTVQTMRRRRICERRSHQNVVVGEECAYASTQRICRREIGVDVGGSQAPAELPIGESHGLEKRGIRCRTQRGAGKSGESEREEVRQYPERCFEVESRRRPDDLM